MNNFRAALLVAILLITSSCSHAARTGASTGATYLRHVVAFRFKPEVTLEQMQRVTEDFRALKQKVPQITEFEGGPDLRFHTKQGKFTHVFIVTVQNEEALAAYGAHPDHKAFSRSADPLLAEVMVIDYWKQ